MSPKQRVRSAFNEQSSSRTVKQSAVGQAISNLHWPLAFGPSGFWPCHFQLTCLGQGQGVRDRAGARARAGARGIRTKFVSDAVDVPSVRMLVTGHPPSPIAPLFGLRRVRPRLSVGGLVTGINTLSILGSVFPTQHMRIGIPLFEADNDSHGKSCSFRPSIRLDLHHSERRPPPAVCRSRLNVGYGLELDATEILGVPPFEPGHAEGIFDFIGVLALLLCGVTSFESDVLETKRPPGSPRLKLEGLERRHHIEPISHRSCCDVGETSLRRSG